MTLDIRTYELPPIGTNCFLVSNPERGETAVFDAPLNAWATVEREAVRTGYRIGGLYLTHGHWDHTLDGGRFNEQEIPVHAHAGDRMFYEKPEVMGVFSMPGIEMKPVRVETWLEHGQRIRIIGRPVEVRHVPGHSPGSILYWFFEDNFAVSGDALFRGGVGRTDFPGCSFEELDRSIRENIYTMPAETVVYPGHGPETSVGREARGNPFVRAEVQG
ncbi:MAG: MBL fold metallo-hydrolase [Oceanipulchritudo sp.]